VGIGKTVMLMLAIYMRQLQLEDAYGKGIHTPLPGAPVFRPYLLITPASNVDQVFTEITKHFQGIFDVWVLYQTAQLCYNPK
jgi:hypothetical protein